jgi:hypothetical protein
VGGADIEDSRRSSDLTGQHVLNRLLERPEVIPIPSSRHEALRRGRSAPDASHIILVRLA